MGLRAVHRVFLSVCAGVVLAAMVAVMPATATAGGLQLTVSPTVSAADTPLSIRVSGAQPGAKVTLTVTSVDADGIKWISISTYTASSAGTVNTATSPDKLVYPGIDPMVPVDLMGAPQGSPAQAAIWPFGLDVSNTTSPSFYWWAKCSLSQAQHGCTWSKPLDFTFTATSGNAHASVTVQRGPALPVTASFESVAATGFYGVFWQPPAGHDNHVGVVEFGGSGGGMDIPIGRHACRPRLPHLGPRLLGRAGPP